MGEVEDLNSFFEACEVYNRFCNNVATFRLYFCGSASSECDVKLIDDLLQKTVLHDKYSPVTFAEVTEWKEPTLSTGILGKALKQFLFSYDYSTKTNESHAHDHVFREEAMCNAVLEKLGKIFNPNSEQVGFDEVKKLWKLTVSQDNAFYEIIYEDFVFLTRDGRVFCLHLGISD